MRRYHHQVGGERQGRADEAPSRRVLSGRFLGEEGKEKGLKEDGGSPLYPDRLLYGRDQLPVLETIRQV